MVQGRPPVFTSVTMPRRSPQLERMLKTTNVFIILKNSHSLFFSLSGFSVSVWLSDATLESGVFALRCAGSGDAGDLDLDHGAIIQVLCC